MTTRTEWKLESRCQDTEWHSAGRTAKRREVVAFMERGKKEGFEVRVWLVTERTETETTDVTAQFL